MFTLLVTIILIFQNCSFLDSVCMREFAVGNWVLQVAVAEAFIEGALFLYFLRKK